MDQTPKPENLMIGANDSKPGFIFGAAPLEVLPGCGAHMNGPCPQYSQR